MKCYDCSPPKRKLVVQKDKNVKKKRKIIDEVTNSDLKTDEELALQLLQQ